ncbi:hypothetical protein [Methylobacterium sp. Leaf466]|uniref:hypothetical protein n=1 Tax=Methylobacterium sp. Leaf466 TaxID=1736386 RepID=UPI0006F60AD6|nr:hypothetical protein [Methylobacterium sp. Leaf466]KQT82399.1 hypothetical protein ASG59_18575 [Methylobacterium sp. Leaf466]
MSQIKINRARRLSKVGPYTETYEAVLRAIGPVVIARVTSQELADLCDRVWDSWERTKRIEHREVVNSGAVWDDENGVLRNVGSAP